MAALKYSAFSCFQCPPLIFARNPRNMFQKPISILQVPSSRRITTLSIHCKKASFINVSVAAAVAASSDQESLPPGKETESEKFDWRAHWYPVMPICDLDKRRPHGKKVLGVDIVVWWDRSENAWRVFDDSCPHRLAPLSEGRIDRCGRLQCVYHGWCFGGSGGCKFIPQAPRDGPPVHTSSKACVAVYPSCVQHGILWFWPNSDPRYKDIHSTKKPHYIPQLDDPSYASLVMSRDIPYGYEVLIENLMDLAHLPYAHYGIMRLSETPESLKADREGGRPIELSVQKLDANGFTAKQIFGECYFIPPCLYYSITSPGEDQSMNSETSAAGTQDEPLMPVPPKKTSLLIFYCIPVSPGNSRLIMANTKNFAVWADRIFPRWISHIGVNLVLDSDLYLLHAEERKLRDVGPLNWHKSCYVPTKADVLVVAFRRWLNKYGGAQVNWGTKFTGLLPPTPPREQLFDRYWTHTVNCSSCSLAYKCFNALEIVLQVISVSSIAIVAAAKQGVTRYALVSMAVLCFAASKWLSHFIYKTFRFHDYDHAFR